MLANRIVVKTDHRIFVQPEVNWRCRSGSKVIRYAKMNASLSSSSMHE